MSKHDSTHTAFEAETVPPIHEFRTLVLCFDGTGNEIGKDPTNVARFFAMLKKDDCNEQMVYYQTGIGTYTNHRLGPVGSVVAKTLDSMFGGGIDCHIKDGYEFLMQNYRAKDRICIFGFSRGAYTARALAGMIHKVGLLPPSNIRHIKFAYDAFLKTDETGWALASVFKKCFSIDVSIEFVGIWDSVGSVGIGMPGLPFSNANTTIKTFRHALAFDERRARFQSNAWMSYENAESTGGGKLKATGRSKKELELSTEKCPNGARTDVKEVWFAGCHSDVGGGSVPYATRHSLARISLRWMFWDNPATIYPEVLPRPEPLLVDGLTIKRMHKRSRDDSKSPGKDEGPNAPVHLTEEEEDLYDALSPNYDMLEISPTWWLLEILPTIRRYVMKDNRVGKALKINLGKARLIVGQEIDDPVKAHRSVKARMQAQYEYPQRSGMKSQYYIPKPTIKFEPAWVD